METLIENYKLSSREMEVIQEVILGQTNKEVANRLNVTEKTVKFHLTNIFKKMGVKSRNKLIVKIMIAGKGTISDEGSTPLPTTNENYESEVAPV